METLKPNRLNKIESVFNEAGLSLPQEINENEAGLIHIAILHSAANMDKVEFEHTLRIIKTSKEAYIVLKGELAKESGKVFILHDGNEWTAQNKGGVKQAKAVDTGAADAAIEALKKESEQKDELLKEADKTLEQKDELLKDADKTLEQKDAEILELRKKLEEMQAGKPETETADAKGAAADAAATKKADAAATKK